MNLPIHLTRADLDQRDLDDSLAPLRARFVLPEGVLYLDGNSLGALPTATLGTLRDVVERQWGRDLIRSWNMNGWMEAPHRVGARIARLVGAAEDEVVVADSTSVNLFKLAAGALAMRPQGGVILTEAGNFPTDLYVLQGLEDLLGGKARLRMVPRADLLDAIDAETALVVLTHAHYKSAERWPMAAVNARAHAVGALTLWDLSHSAGAMALDLSGDGADLAVGCGYKYLNGGPGAPSFVFVARRLQTHLKSPIWGWMGHAAPFDFVDDHAHAIGVERQLVGTPAVLGLAALEAGVAAFDGVEMSDIEAKAKALSQLFIDLVDSRCAGFGLRLVSPRDPDRRASHISWSHPEGYAIMQALIARGVIGDFRAPDILRFGVTPLYLRFVDVWDAVDVLREVLTSGAYHDDAFKQRLAVT